MSRGHAQYSLWTDGEATTPLLLSMTVLVSNRAWGPESRTGPITVTVPPVKQRIIDIC